MSLRKRAVLNKGTAKKGGENVVNGKSMSGGLGGPGGPVPPKGNKHAFAKEFTLKTGDAFKEFALAHPKMTLGSLFGLGALAYQNHKEQDDGLAAITRLQAILSGGQYKDGHLVGLRLASVHCSTRCSPERWSSSRAAISMIPS